MPKISKSPIKKTTAKAKKVAVVIKKPTKVIKKTSTPENKVKHQLKFQKHISQKKRKNICVISTYLFLR